MWIMDRISIRWLILYCLKQGLLFVCGRIRCEFVIVSPLPIVPDSCLMIHILLFHRVLLVVGQALVVELEALVLDQQVQIFLETINFYE